MEAGQFAVNRKPLFKNGQLHIASGGSNVVEEATNGHDRVGDDSLFDKTLGEVHSKQFLMQPPSTGRGNLEQVLGDLMLMKSDSSYGPKLNVAASKPLMPTIVHMDQRFNIYVPDTSHGSKSFHNSPKTKKEMKHKRSSLPEP